MYKLTVFVMDEAVEQVKAALFAAGAGQIGNYSQVCWQVKGHGQFMPMAGSHPHTGQVNTLERLEEWRLEMVVAEAHIKAVVVALKQAHPFETPAYDVIKIEDI